MRGELQGLGPFRLLGVLGEGERAIVYHAEREGAGAGQPPRALKVLRPGLARDEDEVAAFEARAEAALGLGHDAIVETLEVNRVDGQPYVLLERVDGVPLEALFPRRGKARFSPAAAANLLHGVLRALAGAAAAEPPLIHGRLSADNVLVDSDGDVRVASFGTRGEAQGDFLDLGRLAQRIIPDKPEGLPDLDQWLDGLQDGDETFAGPEEALASLPLGPTPAGRQALARAVRRAQKRRAAEAEAAATVDGPSEAPAPGSPAPAPSAKAGERAARGRPPRRAPASAAPRAGDVEGALRQARWVGAICGSLLLAALLIEILAFGR